MVSECRSQYSDRPEHFYIALAGITNLGSAKEAENRAVLCLHPWSLVGIPQQENFLV
jgi:hypothetical protein